MNEASVSARAVIAKVDPARRHVFGWAYVTHDADGRINVDHSGDFVDDVEDLEQAAYQFVLSSRRGDADHDFVQTAVLIESIVFTPEKKTALGITQGSIQSGWWVGFQVLDAQVWERVESGELKAFSVAGRWVATEVSQRDFHALARTARPGESESA